MISITYHMDHSKENFICALRKKPKKELISIATHIATSAVVAYAIQTAIPFGVLALTCTTLTSLYLSPTSTISAAGILTGIYYFKLPLTFFLLIKQSHPELFYSVVPLLIINSVCMIELFNYTAALISTIGNYGVIDNYVSQLNPQDLDDLLDSVTTRIKSFA